MIRLRLPIILISIVIGLIGIWAIQRAIGQYAAVTEAITNVEIVYQPGSFVWQDPDFEHGHAQIQITNQSDRLVTVEHLELNLYFDGDFAGSWYEPWEITHISPGDVLVVPVEFTVTSNSIQQRGGSANLTLSGRTKLAYHEIGEPFTVRLQGTVGQVSEVAQ